MGQVQAPASASQLPTRGRGLASTAAAAPRYLGPSRRRGRRRRRCCGLSVSDTCFAEKSPPAAFPGLQLQPPPPPGPGHAPSSGSSSWLPAAASSSFPSRISRARPSPHRPTAAAAAAAAVRAVTVSGSPRPAGSAPPRSAAPPERPRPRPSPRPRPAARPFFARRLLPRVLPLPHRALPQQPVPGRVRPPGTRCRRGGETSRGGVGAPPFSGEAENGAGAAFSRPRAHASRCPHPPRQHWALILPLSSRPVGLAGCWGRICSWEGQLGRGRLPLPSLCSTLLPLPAQPSGLSLTPLLPKPLQAPFYPSVVRSPFGPLNSRDAFTLAGTKGRKERTGKNVAKIEIVGV